MRLTLELDAKLHRQIKTLAAYHGQTIKGFILERLGLAEAPSEASPKRSSEAAPDETAYLFSSPANATRLTRALKGKAAKRTKFDSVEDLKRALGI